MRRGGEGREQLREADEKDEVGVGRRRRRVKRGGGPASHEQPFHLTGLTEFTCVSLFVILLFTHKPLQRERRFSEVDENT